MSTSEHEERLAHQRREADRVAADAWAQEMARRAEQEEAEFLDWFLRGGADRMAAEYGEVA